MTSISTTMTMTATSRRGDRAGDAALHLFEADYVLHVAKQSGITSWIEVTHEHLIAADRAYRSALADTVAASRADAP